MVYDQFTDIFLPKRLGFSQTYPWQVAPHFKTLILYNRSKSVSKGGFARRMPVHYTQEKELLQSDKQC